VSGSSKYREVTIKDVAKRAGCGIATVSRVLNKSGFSSKETREKVLAAAKDLGFEFNEIGRSLKRKGTQAIGCVIPSLINPVFASALQGIQDELDKNGYQLLLTCTDYDLKHELDAVRTFLQKKVAGLIITTGRLEGNASLNLLKEREIPYSLLFNYLPGSVSGVAVDNRAAGYEVGRRLAGFGHKACGYVSVNLSGSDRSQQRLQGFRQACEDFGLNAPTIVEVSDASTKTQDELCDYLCATSDLTAFFASNDFIALSLISAARRLGLRVPRHLSVVGFDGIEMGLLVDPPLATIVTDPRGMGGVSALRLLMELNVDVENAPPEAEAPYSFREGGSLGRPPSGKSVAEKLQLLRQCSEFSRHGIAERNEA